MNFRKVFELFHVRVAVSDILFWPFRFYMSQSHFRKRAKTVKSCEVVPSERDAKLVKSLPNRMRRVLKFCDSTQLPVYAGHSTDRNVFLQQIYSACVSFGLSDALRPPAHRLHSVPELVRLSENEMLYCIFAEVFRHFPGLIPLDLEPERYGDRSDPVPRAWWCWRYLSDPRLFHWKNGAAKHASCSSRALRVAVSVSSAPNMLSDNDPSILQSSLLCESAGVNGFPTAAVSAPSQSSMSSFASPALFWR